MALDPPIILISVNDRDDDPLPAHEPHERWLFNHETQISSGGHLKEYFLVVGTSDPLYPESDETKLDKLLQQDLNEFRCTGIHTSNSFKTFKTFVFACDDPNKSFSMKSSNPSNVDANACVYDVVRMRHSMHAHITGIDFYHITPTNRDNWVVRLGTELQPLQFQPNPTSQPLQLKPYTKVSYEYKPNPVSQGQVQNNAGISNPHMSGLISWMASNTNIWCRTVNNEINQVDNEDFNFNGIIWLYTNAIACPIMLRDNIGILKEYFMAVSSTHPWHAKTASELQAEVEPRFIPHQGTESPKIIFTDKHTITGRSIAIFVFVSIKEDGYWLELISVKARAATKNLVSVNYRDQSEDVLEQVKELATTRLKIARDQIETAYGRNYEDRIVLTIGGGGGGGGSSPQSTTCEWKRRTPDLLWEDRKYNYKDAEADVDTEDGSEQQHYQMYMLDQVEFSDMVSMVRTNDGTNEIVEVEEEELEKQWAKDCNEDGSGDLTEVMKTVTSHNSLDFVKRYVEFLGRKEFNMDLKGRGEGLKSWESTVSTRGLDNDRRTQLTLLWCDLSKRQLDGWAHAAIAAASKKSKSSRNSERSMWTHLEEMLGFAEQVVAGQSAEAKQEVAKLRAKVEQVVRDAAFYKNDATPSNLYMLSSVWDTLEEVDLNEDGTRNVLGYIETMEPSMMSDQYQRAQELMQERISQLSRLRSIQARVQQTLTYHVASSAYDAAVQGLNGMPSASDIVERGRPRRIVLHEESRNHLFTAGTFKRLRPQLIEFVKEPADRKEGLIPLLRLQLDEAALMEVYRRLMEMTEDLTALSELMRRVPDEEDDQSTSFQRYCNTCLGLVEDIEWACTRTWQQEFYSDAVGDRARWTSNRIPSIPSIPMPIDPGQNKDNNIFQQFATKGERIFPQQGGISRPPPLPPPKVPTMPPSFFDPDVKARRSNAQRNVDHWKSAARRLYVEMRAALAGALVESIPQTGATGLFLTGTVIPRLRSFADAVHSAMRGYLRPADETKVMANDEWARRVERRRQAVARSGYRITVLDGLRFRSGDTATQLLVGLKLLRFGGQVAATWAARKAYNEAFDLAVHAKGGAPPPLTRMLFVFLSVDATFQLFTLGVLVAASYVFLDARKSESRVYVIDDEFIQAFLVDYFVTTLTIGVLGYLIAMLMRRKAFFHLAELGDRAARAYGWSLLGVSGVVAAVPPLCT